MYKSLNLIYNKKMFATSKALTSNVKNIVSKLVCNDFAQSKNGPSNNLGVSNAILNS